MPKILKKGTEVFLIRSWDLRGTVAITPAVVDSWGKRQVHLRLSATDRPAKQRFYVDRVNSGLPHDSLIVPSSIGLRAAEAIALQKGDDIVCKNIDDAQKCIRWNDMKGHDVYSVKGVRETINEQHEPRIIHYSGVN